MIVQAGFDLEFVFLTIHGIHTALPEHHILNESSFCPCQQLSHRIHTKLGTVMTLTLVSSSTLGSFLVHKQPDAPKHLRVIQPWSVAVNYLSSLFFL